jgi:uncharacterized protein YjbI with pentapeptide repeats
MANSEHLTILKQGVEVWNRWREDNPQIKPDLRGAKLRDQHLEEGNFSRTDIRGTDFTNAQLEKANFTGATAGLQKRWATLWVICSLLLAEISGFFSIFIGLCVLFLFDSDSSYQIVGWVVLIMLVIFLILMFRQGIVAGALAGAVAVPETIAIAVAVALALTGAVPEALAVAVAGAALVAVAGALAIAVLVAVAVVVAVAGVGAVVVAVAGVGAVVVAGAGAFLLSGVITGTLAIAGAGAALVALAITFAYIGWRAMKGDARDAWMRNLVVAFAAIGGTSFRGTNLTEANFTDATLRNSDFRKAILIRTYWKNAQKLDLARPGKTYLKTPEVQQWLIGKGKDKNFDRLDLRGINFQGYNLTEASFIGADISEASLQDADLSRAKLVQAQVDKTDFTGATLTGAYIEDWGITADTIFRGVICDYAFMRLPPEKRPDSLKLPPEESLDPNARRKPDDWNKNFEEGEFEDFIVPLIQTLDLYHNQAVDPRLVAISFKDLQQAHPEAELELISMEKKGKNRDKLHLKVATSPQADLSALHAEYFVDLDYLKSLSPETQQALLIERGATLQMVLAEGSKITVNNSQNQKNNNMEGNNYSITGDNNQAVQGTNNQVTQQSRVYTNAREEITQAKVIELLAELEQKILSSELSEETKNKTLNRLSTVADDVKKEKPDKKLAAGNLKRVTETLSEASKTTEEAKKLWNNIQPILEIVGKWLGVGIKFLTGM